MMKGDLKLADLKANSEVIPMKLLSVRVPIDLIARIDHVVDLLNAGKGEVVVALLNEGLEQHEEGRGLRGQGIVPAGKKKSARGSR